MTSDATARARAFVEEHRAEAQGLGVTLGDLIDDPESFVEVLREGLTRLSDPAYAAEQERVAPGSGAVIGVRWPLVHAVERQLRQPLADRSSASSVSLAQRLIRDDLREIRLFAVAPLSRALPDDPERSWQLIRRLGRTATDWISVDAIADLVAQGVLLEAFRWAELELLVYSQSPWERRLVGSTLARLPYQWPAYRRRGLDAAPALTLIKSLIGDADPNVQKALSWALRSWAHVDEDAVTELLYAEAATAIREGDGHRAWVIRDTLPDLPDVVARDLRDRLSRVRRRHDAPSTSEAATAVAGFGALTGLSDTVVGEQGERMARIGR